MPQWFEKLYKSKKQCVVFLVTIILIYLVCRGFTYFDVKTLDELFAHEFALERINYLIQIFAGVVVVLGAIVAVWQYVLTARCERAKINNDRVEKAVNLSAYYKDNILTKVAALRLVFSESGVTAILEQIKPVDMVAFDADELTEKLSVADRQKLSQIMQSKEMANLILLAGMRYNLNLDIERYFSILEEDEDMSSIKRELISLQFMSQVQNDLLNNLEYFAMNFTHKVADESVVFQSLHQTYLEAVQLLYYDIAKNNKPDGRQFYTNVVELYKIWYDKSRQNREMVIRDGRKINKGSC